MARTDLSRGALVLVCLTVALVLLPPVVLALGEGFYIRLATRIVIFALAAVSLDLILGHAGMVSFGHAAFVGIGSYVVGILYFHGFHDTPLFGLPGSVNALLVWPLAALVGGISALVIGAICLRTSGISFIMITLAFAQMLYYLLTSLRTYGGDDGLALWTRSELPDPVDLDDNVIFYYVCVALLIGFLLLCRRLVDSRFGRVLRACKDNERRLRALGVATFRYKLTAFVIAGAAAGLAGALLANATLFVGPAYLHWSRSGELIVMVVMGGMGTLIGPVFGAAALILLEELLSEWTEHWQIVLGPILLFIVLFARRGLYGILMGLPGGPIHWLRRRRIRPGDTGLTR